MLSRVSNTKGSIILFAINNAAIRCQAVLVTDCLNVNYYMLPLVTKPMTSHQ